MSKEYEIAGTVLPRITKSRYGGEFLVGEEFHHRPLRCRSHAKKIFFKKNMKQEAKWTSNAWFGLTSPNAG